MDADPTTNQSPIKVDIGASAKFGVELKGEIPGSSLGRLVDSLCDIIRPFSEARGLKADQLRLQREDTLYNIAQKALERLRVENAVIKPIPLKTIVPLLEKASLEEPSGELVEWWADLLASTAQNKGLQHPVYSDILSKITAAEAFYLKRIVSTSDVGVIERNEPDIESIFHECITQKMREQGFMESGEYGDLVKERLSDFRLRLEASGCVVFYLTFPTEGMKFWRNLNEIYEPFDRPYQDIIDVLRTVSLVKSIFLNLPIPAPYIGEFQCSGEILVLTSLGRNLLRACLRS